MPILITKLAFKTDNLSQLGLKSCNRPEVNHVLWQPVMDGHHTKNGPGVKSMLELHLTEMIRKLFIVCPDSMFAVHFRFEGKQFLEHWATPAKHTLVDHSQDPLFFSFFSF